MKKFIKLIAILFSLQSYQFVSAQNSDYKGFELMGKSPKTIQINQQFTKNAELVPFKGQIPPIFGLAIKASITFNDDNSLVRVIMVDTKGEEYLVYETYPLLEESSSFTINNLCEETGLLNRVQPKSLKIEVSNATLNIFTLTYSSSSDQTVDENKTKKEKKDLQNVWKISQINKAIKAKGLFWIAGETEVSDMSFAAKKKLYGQSTFPSGIEYYSGGVLSAENGSTLKSATATAIVDNWDWRDRHGKNWITSIKNQGNCGSCWAFAAIGATEAQVNLFYNQALNMDLSEQTLLSCSGAGTCSGGYPDWALDYIKNTGIIDEGAFLYSATDQVCTNKSSSPLDQIKISGRMNFGSTEYPVTEDNLKKMMIKYGPLSGGLLDWSHAMTLVGWKVVKEGDRFYYRDLNKSRYWYTVPAGSALIGKTVWIFKNSWGVWGDGGYIYVETNISNFEWTHALIAPLTSLKQNYTVQCTDNDLDGYYWWGLGPKPAHCPLSPSLPDGDDSDATRGPIDANGNFVSLTAPPVADFASDKTTLTIDGSVNFTDVSTSSPTSFSWTFEGGTPATSIVANPIVVYKTAGKYDVTLVVHNAYGSDTRIKIDQITVNPIITDPIIPSYCSSKGIASKEWITAVSMNGSTYTSGSSGSTGYENFTTKIFNVNINSNYTINLTPKYSGKANPSGWSVWIDLNHDSDFNDTGEQILVASNIKTAVSKNITIPASALAGITRMRVSMKRSAVPIPCEIFAYGEVEDYTINISSMGAGNLSLKSAETSSPEIIQPRGFKLFPNPVDQLLNLIVDEVYEQDVYSIFSIQGVLICKRPLNSIHTQVDVSNFPTGIYLVKLQNGSQSFNGKFIKER